MRHDEIYPDDRPEPTIEFAWAAGLFEGEGCLTISHGRQPNGSIYRQPRLKLNSTDRDVVERFHRIIGVGSVIEDRAQERRGWKRQWSWIAGSRDDVRETVIRLFPLLGNRRQARAVDILVACDEGRARSRRSVPSPEDLGEQ